jgi:hypothetical protein
MLSIDLDQEKQSQCPVYMGSEIDRLSNWCKEDCLEQEKAVIEALACCREILHSQSKVIAPQHLALFPIGAVATLICEVQSRMNGTGECSI